MKKADVIIGAIYAGLGRQVSATSKVRLLEITARGPGHTDKRVLTEEIGTGTRRWKNLRSFMVAYRLESMPDGTWQQESSPVFTDEEIEYLQRQIGIIMKKSKTNQ